MSVNEPRNEHICYAIVGSGKVARHFQHYLRLLKLQQTDSPAEASHILVAVSDSAIASVASEQPQGKTLVHFSGAHTIPGVYAAHPLMTFTDQLHEVDWYKKIPFAIDRGQTLERILPGLQNPWFTLDQKQRHKYHALVAMAGNFANLLWRETSRELNSSCGVSASEMEPYLQQVVSNFISNPEDSLTGPIARKDWSTIEMHLAALKQAPALREVYQAFLHLAQEDLK